MEKMNQVSVSEFFAKSKEEMYDMAVEMVEKYNRLIDRHAVYTDALNNDIADKAAKIDLLEKEIEGRKEGYYALKELMDTKYISIDENNKIVDQFKEEIKKLNKCIMNKNESINTGNEAIINLRKEIGAHEEENKRLSEKITSLKGTITELSHEIDNYKSWNADLHRDIKSEINNKNDLVDAYEKKFDEFENRIKELKKERDKHMARVNDLRMELDCVKASKEKHEEAARDKVVEGLRETITYWRNKYVAAQEEIEKLDGTIEEWKNKERIRTNELRATERKVEELWGLLNELKKEKKEGDNYAREGFKLYVKNTLAEAEGNKNEANEVITEAVRSAYAEWSKTQKEEETKKRLNEKFGVGGIVDEFKEETEIKGNGRTSSGRYPWGAKVNDIPCGEDAIE